MSIYFMPHKPRVSFFLHHNCLICVVVVVGRFRIHLRLHFDEILRNIQAEAREFVSNKNRKFYLWEKCLQYTRYLSDVYEGTF